MSHNILLDSLPETVTVDGKEFFIDTDFRTCIIFEKIMSSDMSPKEKVEEAICLFFPDEVPSNADGAVNAIMYIYRCGEDENKMPPSSKYGRKNGSIQLKPKIICDYEFDAPYVYGAFLSQYQIDLNSIDYLHWWKFQALFRSLDSRNQIVEIMRYRAADLGKIKDKNERERIAHMKQVYALPRNMSFEDKVAMAGAAFGGGFA